MSSVIDITLLASNQKERKRLYQIVKPLYRKRYGKTGWETPFNHAQVVTEEVARYSASSIDKRWAGRCVMLASVHPLDMDMAADLAKKFAGEECAYLLSSFSRFNILREQDEAPPEMKKREVYLSIITPYTVGNLAFLPPEAFVRVVDMSQPQFYKGRGARELHAATSRGSIDEINYNLAVSMRMVWRSAAISLLLFGCYDRQSDLAAEFLYPKLFRKVSNFINELSSEIDKVRGCFEDHVRQLVTLASHKGIPVLQQKDRETGKLVDFTIRVKTPGSTTLKLVDKKIMDPSGCDFDPDCVLERTHDIVASTLVSEKNCDAEALFHLICSKDQEILMETEPLFHGNGGRLNSLPDYREVGHLDYDAKAFGAVRLIRTELHVRSYRGYVDYYISRTCGRGVRESPLIADAWGDMNYSIVKALGTFRLGYQNGFSNGNGNH